MSVLAHWGIGALGHWGIGRIGALGHSGNWGTGIGVVAHLDQVLPVDVEGVRLEPLRGLAIAEGLTEQRNRVRRVGEGHAEQLRRRAGWQPEVALLAVDHEEGVVGDVEGLLRLLRLVLGDALRARRRVRADLRHVALRLGRVRVDGRDVLLLTSELVGLVLPLVVLGLPRRHLLRMHRLPPRLIRLLLLCPPRRRLLLVNHLRLVRARARVKGYWLRAKG